MSKSDKKSIVFVSNRTDISTHYKSKLSRELNIDVKMVSTIQEVFPLLSDPSFNPTSIAIDVNDCYKTLNVDLLDIMHLLSTMLKCSLYRNDTVTKKRQTSLIALVSNVTPVSVIRNVMLIPAVDHIGLTVCGDFSYDVVKEDTENYINGIFKYNKFIKQKLSSKPTATVKTTVDQIVLTPRQTQILNLVTSRGASNKVIARMLNLSESTIKLHLGIIFKKYGVKNRTQLAVSAIETTNKELANV